MTTEIWQALISQAPGVAGVLIVVVIFLKWGVNPMLAYLKDRDAQWLIFLKDQREQSTATLAQMTVGIQANTEATIEIGKKLAEHDAWTRGAIEQMIKARQTRK